jgi:GT2 family glycosyltransferase/glycosyltransferase involved in cell wall biosynthesis
LERLRVLYVSDRTDAPYRYRCVHACEQLRDAGAIANILQLGDRRLPGAVEAYSVVVLFRLPWRAEVEEIVAAARRAGVPIVFDCDDLVFDPAAAALMPFRVLFTAEDWERAYGHQLRDLRRTFDICDLFIGSTATLADWSARLGKPGGVHPNVVPSGYLKLGPWITRARPALQGARTIGYFAGSNTHDLDFAVVAPALRRALASDPSARLLIAGYLDIAQNLRGFESRVVRIPHVSFRVLPWELAACSVTIAPLAAINEFTNAKSALKMFEPGAFGVPVIASPSAEMRRSIEHGRTGWLAHTADEWVHALREALNPANAREVGTRAKNAVIRSHTAAAVAGQLSHLLSRVTIPATGPAPALEPLEFDEYTGRSDPISRSAAHARRARDLAVVMSALRYRPSDTPAPDAIDLFVSRIADEQPLAPTRTPNGEIILIAGDPERSGWTSNAEIERGSVALGERRALGVDAQSHSPLIELEGCHARYAVVRLRASTPDGHANAQLYWRAGLRRNFSESRSITLSLIADGTDRTYLIDLAASSIALRQRRTHFRFDPLDRPGSVRVLSLVLLPEGWRTPESVSQRTPRAVPVNGSKRKVTRSLRRLLSRLQVGDCIWVTSKRKASWLRSVLERRLAETGCVVEQLVAEPEGTTRCLLRRIEPSARRGVDIIVPVYNAGEQTLRCLKSVMAHARGDFRVVVIDDGSSDPQLWPALRKFAAGKECVVLLRNDRNVGFVQTCNRGMEHAGSRDVLLLNSDTKVYRGFLSRMQKCVYADATTGIVSPLSNNATICSAPKFCRPNELPDGMTGAQMARLVRRSAQKRRLELVTPVGFCMYIRAELLEKVGGFDAERFGRGFGEENDLGERAKQAGWKVRLADDVYVWHEGKASFGQEGFALEAKNAKALEARHPGYHAAVAHFIRENPLAPIHDDLRFHLARKTLATDAAPLSLLHASPFAKQPGGSEYVALDLVRLLRLPRAVLAYPVSGGLEVAEVIAGDVEHPTRHVFPLSSPVPRFCHEHREAEGLFEEILRLFQVGWLHIHHLMFWPLALHATLRRLGIPYVITVHDFYGVCPSQNLLDVRTHTLCCPHDGADPTRTAACLRALFEQAGQAVPEDLSAFATDHRTRFQALFAEADKVLFPSPSALQIVTRVHPSARHHLLPHGYVPHTRLINGVRSRANPSQSSSMSRKPGPLRVALIGEIAYPAKGAREYLHVMDRCRDEALEWHIFGPTDRFDFDTKLAKLGGRVRIVRHGAYCREEVSDLLRQAHIDLALILPVWPETFSLTLSEVLAANVAVVASRQGALVDRLEGRPDAILVDSAAEAADVLKSLCNDSGRVQSLLNATAGIEAPDANIWLNKHRELYAECRRRAPRDHLRQLRCSDLCRLSATRIRRPLTMEASSSTQPASRFANASWYRNAERLKPYLPETVRALVRRQLAQDGYKTLVRYRLPGPNARIGGDIRLDARYLRTARCTSFGTDPHIVLDLKPISPNEVDAIRFNLWCSHPGYAYAQIYWRHQGDSAFCEEKSAIISLNATFPDWQEYVMRLDERAHPSWYSGDRIVGLRFDPVNFTGLFCVGELALCAARPRVPTPT